MDKKKNFKSCEGGTIKLNSFDEFNQVCEEFEGQVVSPGGAAGRLDVSRAYIINLKKRETYKGL